MNRNLIGHGVAAVGGAIITTTFGVSVLTILACVTFGAACGLWIVHGDAYDLGRMIWYTYLCPTGMVPKVLPLGIYYVQFGSKHFVVYVRTVRKGAVTYSYIDRDPPYYELSEREFVGMFRPIEWKAGI